MRIIQDIFNGARRFTLLGILLCLTSLLYAQKDESKLADMRVEADDFYEAQDYLKALKAYKKVETSTAATPLLNYRIGVCMYKLKDQRSRAGVYFEKAIFGMPQDMYSPLTVVPEVLESYYYLGQHYHLTGEFDIAITMYQTYQNYRGLYLGQDASSRLYSLLEINNLINKSVYAMEHKDDETKVTVELLGDGINTAFPDYAPIISTDGSKLIFTSRRKGTGGLVDPRGEYFEDIYETELVDKKWSEPKGIGSIINTDMHDAGIGLSVDGKQLMMFRTNQSLTGGDIYNSKLENGQWSEPSLFTSPHYNEDEPIKGVNTSYIEPSACMNNDRDVLIFSSNRPGGYGGLDLYRVVRLPDGQWSYAVNLGPTINTPFNEDAPHLYSDNKTLYFSSKGHRNMGGYDIFKTVLRNGSGNLRSDIGLLWSIPENMKAPINSVADDIYYVVAPDGLKGYFASNRDGGIGSSDIYSAQLRNEDAKMIVVKGSVISMDDNRPLSAHLTVLDQENHRLRGEYNTNPQTGAFVMILSAKLKYRMIVEAEGHYSITEDYFLVSFSKDYTILNKDIYLPVIKIKVAPASEYLFSYVLENVRFNKKSFSLALDVDSAFVPLINTMLNDSSMVVEIASHTDDVGGQESNLALSQMRAETIKQYLIDHGIEEERISAKGYGESTPIADNKTEQGRAVNRRIEVRVIEE